MTKQKKHRSPALPILFLVLGLTGFGIFLAYLLKQTKMTMFDPKGQIAAEELKLMIFTAVVLCGVAILTLAVLYFFAWKYRETNPKLDHDPNTRRGGRFEFMIWAIPCLVMVFLSVIMWSATHRLEPQKAIASDQKPMRIEVVALRWKWLFIYPEQRIATVNYVQIPVGTPIEFDLTADETPMSSFWIPHLSGMLYAMTGHVNRLNLIADKPGEFPGSTAEVNGSGFAGMKFIANATDRAAFDVWVSDVQQTGDTLDAAAYKALLAPSEDNPTASYANVSPDLYAKVIQKYMGSGSHGSHGSGEESDHSDSHEHSHEGY